MNKLKSIFTRVLTALLFLFGASQISLVYAADSELIIFDWSGYEDPNFFLSYNEKHGDDPSFAFFGDEEEAFQKLRSGFKADVAHPCSQSISKWRDAGIIEPWDISRIPLHKNLIQDFAAADGFVHNGDVYFIPVDWGATATAYNPEKVDASEVKTLQIFVDPKYQGRTSIGDNVDDAYALAYLATGSPDWTKVTVDDFKRASDWLREAHKNVVTYWVEGAELAQLMSSGQVLVSWAWNETPVTMGWDGITIGYEREAKEGSSTWVCGYVNPKDGQGSEDKAYDFINAWLDSRTADYLVNEWGYGHSNAEAMKGQDAEWLVQAGLGPVSVPTLGQLPMNNEIREMMIAEFEKIKAGF